MYAQDAHLYMLHDSAVHLLAEALQRRFSKVQFVHKHINAEGFICEVALEHALVAEDLAELERDIACMIASNWPCRSIYWSHQRALAHARHHGQHDQFAQFEQASSSDDVLRPAYAANPPQLCSSWPGADWPDDLAIYQHGAFVEICSGPHVEFAGEIGVCRLTRVEVVRGSEMLQRISGRVEV